MLPSTSELLKSQEEDPVYGQLIQFLKLPEEIEATPEVKDLLREAGTYSMDGITALLLYEYHHNGRDTRVPVLQPSVCLSVMRALHELPISGYLGRKKSIHRIRSQFYWRGVNQDVTEFVKSCEHCQKRKATQPRKAGYLQLFSAFEPFQVIS